MALNAVEQWLSDLMFPHIFVVALKAVEQWLSDLMYPHIFVVALKAVEQWLSDLMFPHRSTQFDKMFPQSSELCRVKV